MELILIKKNARSAVIEISDGGLFYTRFKYEIYINGKFYCQTEKTINCIFGLLPETEYEILAKKSDGMESKINFATDYEFVALDVRKFGAKGDGIADDTVHIQAAIMACPKNSRVLIPKGIYKITNIFLKSDVKIELAKDAVLLAESERISHAVFPGMIESYDEKDEYNLGTWEGNPLDMFAGIITGVDVQNVEIYGEGCIDGNASFENWWFDEKKMRIAFRPRIMFFNRCKGIAVFGLSFKNSPSWTIHPYFSQDIELLALNINNPKNSPNTDGIDIESSKNIAVKGAYFDLGDDCIAIKSGKIYMGRKYKTPSEQIYIYQCCMENGHGAITLGSEMSAGINGVLAEKCLFLNTDRGIRIKTRRGRGNLAVIDNVAFKDIKMQGVLTPFVVNCFYFCDPDGKSDYVQNKNPMPVDERIPFIKRLVFENITCLDSHVAAAYFYGLPERKIKEIILKNVFIAFAANAKSGFPDMLSGIKECSKQGIFAENVEKLSLDNVDICGYEGEKYIICNVDDVSIE